MRSIDQLKSYACFKLCSSPYLFVYSLGLLIIGLWPFNFWQPNKVSHDSVNGLRLIPVIPKRFKPYKRAFLEMPSSLKEIWTNIGDILINLLGFVPLGFLLSMYLFQKGLSFRNSLLLSIGVGLCLSLIIELLQTFLRTRDSSMIDLIANTFGTAIGSFVYKMR